MSHDLTFLALRAEKLILELDAFDLLIFTRCKTLQIVGDNQDLVFADFQQLIFDGSWLERGRILPRAKTYKGGTVKFARPF